jgi:hypothetical protein
MFSLRGLIPYDWYLWPFVSKTLVVGELLKR